MLIQVGGVRRLAKLPARCRASWRCHRPHDRSHGRVAIDWTLDLLFAKDFVQFLTLRAPVMSMRMERPAAAKTSEVV